MKKLLALSFLVFGCSHSPSDDSRMPSSAPQELRSLDAGELLQKCNSMLRTASVASKQRRLCELSFTNLDKTSECNAKLLATDRQYETISKSSEIFSPDKKTSRAVLNTNREKNEIVVTYGFEFQQAYISSPSGAVVMLNCKSKGLKARPKDIVTSFERTMESTGKGIVTFLSAGTEEVPPPAQ